MPKILPGETDIYALTDSRLSLGRPVAEVARCLLDAGVRILQYREKHLKAGAMLEECRALRQLTANAGACFIVNDHIDIAMLVGADGVHIGQEDLPVPEVRRLVGKDMIIGLSTHSPEQARAAVAAGAKEPRPRRRTPLPLWPPPSLGARGWTPSLWACQRQDASWALSPVFSIGSTASDLPKISSVFNDPASRSLIQAQSQNVKYFEME